MRPRTHGINFSSVGTSRAKNTFSSNYSCQIHFTTVLDPNYSIPQTIFTLFFQSYSFILSLYSNQHIYYSILLYQNATKFNIDIDTYSISSYFVTYSVQFKHFHSAKLSTKLLDNCHTIYTSKLIRYENSS